jgi:hypothetical protein
MPVLAGGRFVGMISRKNVQDLLLPPFGPSFPIQRHAPHLIFVLHALIRHHAETDFSYFINAQSTFGALVMALMANVFSTAIPSLTAFPEERPVFLREFSTDHYSVASYFASRLTIELVVNATQVTVSTMLTYFMCGFGLDYWVLWTAVYLLACASSALGVMVGSATENAATAIELLPAVFMPQILFSGQLEVTQVCRDHAINVVVVFRPRSHLFCRSIVIFFVRLLCPPRPHPKLAGLADVGLPLDVRGENPFGGRVRRRAVRRGHVVTELVRGNLDELKCRGGGRLVVLPCPSRPVPCLPPAGTFHPEEEGRKVLLERGSRSHRRGLLTLRFIRLARHKHFLHGISSKMANSVVPGLK